jgi:hypothetical protein
VEFAGCIANRVLVRRTLMTYFIFYVSVTAALEMIVPPLKYKLTLTGTYIHTFSSSIIVRII